MRKLAIAIHGGAGGDPVNGMTPELKREYHYNLGYATDLGYDILERGGSSIEAIEAALRYIEDSPLFNAGRGSSYTSAGTHEMDAAIMCGTTLRVGAVAAVKRVRNPITLARTLMERGKHLFMVSRGAEEFALSMNLEFMPEDYFHSENKYAQWKLLREQEAKGKKNATKDHGTAGAVALDSKGNLAAGTTTGGLTNKWPGRVGDSPLIGAGTFANELCAVSCSGDGEYMIRTVAAHSVAMLMDIGEMPLEEACDTVVFERLDPYGGDAAIMGMDRSGNLVYSFNTPRFYRGWRTSDGIAGTAIYKD